MSSSFKISDRVRGVATLREGYVLDTSAWRVQVRWDGQSDGEWVGADDIKLLAQQDFSLKPGAINEINPDGTFRTRVPLKDIPKPNEMKGVGTEPPRDWAIPSPPAKLPTAAKARKDVPIVTGVLDYFPRAIAAVAELSRIGNEQHNPGQPMHWAREKSTDHADCIGRHLVDRGTFDVDKVLHDVKCAWRSLAMAELALEKIAQEEEARRQPSPQP